MSGYISENYWHLGNYSYVYYRYILEKLCHKQLEKEHLLLDAGCGPMISSLPHVPTGLHVIGVDLSYKNVTESNQRKKEKGYKNFDFIRASIIFLPFREKAFDLIVCADVLEHVSNNRKAIEEISRVCKTGAEFFLSTSNLLNPLLMFDSFAPKKIVRILTERFAGEHYERHSRLSFSRLLQTLNNSNFQVCDAKLIGYPLFQAPKYEFSNKKLPWYAYFWIVFNKMTSKKPLIFLKEATVCRVIKKG